MKVYQTVRSHPASPKVPLLRSLMASTIQASIFCTEGLRLMANALCDQIQLPSLTTLVSDGYAGEGGQYGDGGGGVTMTSKVMGTF